MKRYICIVGCCIAVVGILRPSLAAQPKKNTAHPASTSSPVSGATTSPNFHMPPAALQRQMHELERAEHLVEMSARNDHSSHEANAARHLQAAINELKLEAIKNAQAKHAGQATQAAAIATPGVREK
jgi:hypothetical protein